MQVFVVDIVTSENENRVCQWYHLCPGELFLVAPEDENRGWTVDVELGDEWNMTSDCNQDDVRGEGAEERTTQE